MEAPIASGGMGEVYRGRDLALGRPVAIKVLAADLGEDAALVARFEREARAVASLSHPNVVAIHHLGQESGRWYAVTELLAGQTLRARRAQGPISLRKQLRIGASVARGLAAAHARGIIHRDLKPENVFLTEDGQVKVLDFGLARWSDAGALRTSGEAATLTQAGVIVGTPGYMSPEQARGEALDERSDVFALGCVLFEMVAGRPAFVRETAVESLVALLQEDLPPFPPEAPPELCELVRNCLERNLERRVQKAHDVALFLEAVASAGSGAHAMPHETLELLRRGPAGRMRWLPWALLAIAVAAGAAGWLLRETPPPPPELRYLTFAGDDRSPAGSPDGRLVAFASERGGRQRIWLKQVASGDETPLTDGPDDFPRFSPDGASLVFSRTDGLTSVLMRVAAVGGEPRRLVEDATDGDFSPDGERIAFVRWRAEGGVMGSLLASVAADGTDEREIARFPGRTVLHPRWSPDGRHVAVVDSEESPRMGLLVVESGSGEARELTPAARAGLLSAPVWSGDDELLVAVTGSPASRHGASTRVVRQPLRGDGARTLFWNAALNGVMDRLGETALVLEARIPRTELLEVEGAAGASGPRLLTHGASADRQPVYSPDGARVVFSSNRSGNLDLWALEPATGSLRRLTDHPAEDWDPAFLPDGRLLWSSNRTGHFEVWVAEPDGTGPRQVTRDGVRAENPTATRDGRWIVYNSRRHDRPGVWRVAPDGTGATLLVPGITRLPETSPDGRHVLYLTDIRLDRLSLRAARIADGRVEDFVISVPAEGGRVRWLPDGSAAAFTAPDAQGRLTIFAQPFRPGRDTTAERRPLPGLDLQRSVDSFGFAPGAGRLCVSVSDQVSHLMLADGVETRR